MCKEGLEMLVSATINYQNLAHQSCKRAQCVVSWHLSFRAAYPQKSPIYYHTKALNLRKFKIIFLLDSAFRSLFMVHCKWHIVYGTVRGELIFESFQRKRGLIVTCVWQQRIAATRYDPLQHPAIHCTLQMRSVGSLQHFATHCTLQMRGVGYLCALEHRCT